MKTYDPIWWKASTGDLLGGSKTEADPNRSYYVALDQLTAKDWSRSG
jgi:hypothetical protein